MLVPKLNKKRKNRTTRIRLGTWNVRTLCTGFGEDLNGLENVRKTAVVDRELKKLNVDIAGLQETRLAEAGSLKEKNYTFFWQGLSTEEPRLHGVGFAVHNRLLDSITTPVGISERVSSLRLTTSNGCATIICAYAPTLAADHEVKDRFYQQISNLANDVPKEDQLYVLGDFNARVGADQSSWPACIGNFGIGKMNNNGQRLLEFCSDHQLCVTNTYFSCKPVHRVSWRHPRSAHWHQLDVVLARRSDLNSIQVTRSFHSADCDTDHTLVISKTKLELKKQHCARPKGIPRLNTNSMQDPAKCEDFRSKFEESLASQAPPNSPDGIWENLRTAMYDSAMESFGKKLSIREDWIEEYQDVLLPLLDKKKKALIAQKQYPSQSNNNRLKQAKQDLQRESRRCANEYWNKLCKDIQEANDRGDMRTVHQKIKVALGPQPCKVAPIKSKSGDLIHDKKQQLDRWIEHYSDLYSVERHLDQNVQLPSLPVMAELDDEPSIDELSKAIDVLSSGKAPGSDAIPAELLKRNKAAIIPHLHQLLVTCWRNGTIPHEMRNASIITLYKNKGDKGDCNNYRGISLLSIAGKAIARVLLTRLQALAERVLPESQCGFRANRSTVDMIFSLRQLQEKCREQQRPLYMAFVDLTKAFDTVSRSGLYRALEAIGCPPILLSLTKAFHDEMQATVQYDGSKSDSFNIRSGVKQGCVLAPTLFGICLAVLLETALGNTPGDVLLHWRSDGSLYRLSRLKAKTIQELLFADDAALVTHSQE